jgi:dTDP-4-dehydrorhamnose 3,5-epimerase
MRFLQMPLSGAILIEPEVIVDERGLFARLFDAEAFNAHNLPTHFVQASTSYNRQRGTLRGLHYQAEPYAEGKVVRCTAGSLFDVIVDVRSGSPTFGRWHGVNLDADNRLALFIPPGFAHGFQTLADHTEIFYQMTQHHVPDAERGITWNDPAIAVAWPIPPAIMSQRDLALPTLASRDGCVT